MKNGMDVCVTEIFLRLNVLNFYFFFTAGSCMNMGGLNKRFCGCDKMYIDYCCFTSVFVVCKFEICTKILLVAY